MTCVAGNNLATHCLGYVHRFLHDCSHWSVEQSFILECSFRMWRESFWLVREQTSLLANETLRQSHVIRWLERWGNQLSATYQVKDTFRNSSVTAQIEKPTQKGCEKARRKSLPSDFFATSRRLSTTGANCGIKLINHRLDYRTEPLSAFDYRIGPITLTASPTAIGRLPGLSRHRQRLLSSRLPIISWHGQY